MLCRIMIRTYAIGDIHGSLGKLRRLLTRCERDAGGEPMRLVFLGDYIDRGPESCGVIEHLIALQARRGEDVVFLKGNHEALALASDDGALESANWLMSGGDATLKSY